MVAAGAAAMWFLERRNALPGQGRPALPWPPDPVPPEPPPPFEPPVAEESPEPESPEPEAPDPESPDPSRQTPEPDPEPEPVPEPEPDPEPEPEPPVAFSPSEQPTREQSAVEREGEPGPVDVTAVVDDLIAPTAGEESIVDAEVVEDEPGPPEPTGDEQIAQAVRDELATVPGIPADEVTVEVTDGTLYLRGKIDRPGTISEVDRRVREVEGVSRVRNLLHLPGTPPPV